MKTYDFAKAMRNLGVKEFMVVDYLYNHKYFDGSYTDFSLLYDDNKANVTNMTKSIKDLEKKQIIKVEHIQLKNTSPMTSMRLNNNWENNLIKNYL